MAWLSAPVSAVRQRDVHGMWLSRAPWRRALALLLLSCARQTGDGGLGLRWIAAKVVKRSDAPAAPPTYAQYLNYTVAELEAATSNKVHRSLPCGAKRVSSDAALVSVTTSSRRSRSFSTPPC